MQEENIENINETVGNHDLEKNSLGIKYPLLALLWSSLLAAIYFWFMGLPALRLEWFSLVYVLPPITLFLVWEFWLLIKKGSFRGGFLLGFAGAFIEFILLMTIFLNDLH